MATDSWASGATMACWNQKPMHAGMRMQAVLRSTRQHAMYGGVCSLAVSV